MDPLPLAHAIAWLTEGRNLRISVHDLSGLLHVAPPLGLPAELMVHEAPVCRFAKTVLNHLPLCLRCKRAAVARALASETPFCGRCHMGVSEWVIPVWHEGRPICVIFVGNLWVKDATCVPDRHAPESDRCRRRARNRGATSDAYDKAFSGCQTIKADELSRVVEPGLLLSDSIRARLAAQDAEMAACPPLGWDRASGAERRPSPKAPGIPPQDRPSPSWRSTRNVIVQTVLDHAQMDYARPLTLRHLARLLFVDESYLCRLFRRETGMTFTAHLRAVRMEVARRLLLQTALPVHEVARRVGISHTGHFIRLFQHSEGLTPAAWRGGTRKMNLHD